MNYYPIFVASTTVFMKIKYIFFFNKVGVLMAQRDGVGDYESELNTLLSSKWLTLLSTIVAAISIT